LQCNHVQDVMDRTVKSSDDEVPSFFCTRGEVLYRSLQYPILNLCTCDLTDVRHCSRVWHDKYSKSRRCKTASSVHLWFEFQSLALHFEKCAGARTTSAWEGANQNSYSIYGMYMYIDPVTIHASILYKSAQTGWWQSRVGHLVLEEIITTTGITWDTHQEKLEKAASLALKRSEAQSLEYAILHAMSPQ